MPHDAAYALAFMTFLRFLGQAFGATILRRLLSLASGFRRRRTGRDHHPERAAEAFTRRFRSSIRPSWSTRRRARLRRYSRSSLPRCIARDATGRRQTRLLLLDRRHVSLPHSCAFRLHLCLGLQNELAQIAGVLFFAQLAAKQIALTTARDERWGLEEREEKDTTPLTQRRPSARRRASTSLA